MTTLPTISHETLPSTPANEWAAKTTASLRPDSEIRNFDDGNKEHERAGLTTPGPDFPGAYPGDLDEPNAFTTGDAKNAAIGVLHKAKQYIPTQQDVEKAMLTASETAKHFLPNAVTSYFRAFSLPLSNESYSIFTAVATQNKQDKEIALTGVKSLRENGEGGVDERTDHHTRPLARQDSKMQSAETSTVTPSALHVPNGGGDFTVPPPSSSAGSSKTELSSVAKLSTQAEAGSDTTVTPPSTIVAPTPSVHSSESPHTPLTADAVVNNDATSHTTQPTLPPDDLKSPDTAHDVVLPGKDASNLSKTDTQASKFHYVLLLRDLFSQKDCAAAPCKSDSLDLCTSDPRCQREWSFSGGIPREFRNRHERAR